MWLRKLKNKIQIKLAARRLSVPEVNVNCRYFEVDNSSLSIFVVNDLLPLVGYTPFPLNELMLMSAALCRIQPTHVFEWGTNIGKSARIFYETSKKFDLGVIIHSIDLPDNVYHSEHPGKQRGALVKGCRHVFLHTGDGLSKAIEIAGSNQQNIRYLFFLDGDHSYESVSRELNGITENFPAASILVHDTFHQSPESGYNIGPYQAVDDFVRKWPARYERISPAIGLPGMDLLYKS